MNNIGLLIKMARIQQNMKQVSLAKGICSTSYLSKIENNQTIASDDVVQLLLQRLNLDYEDLSTDQESVFLSDLYALYKDAIIDRKKHEVISRLSFYTEKNYLFKNEKNFHTYNLYLFRLHLITDPLGKKTTSLLTALAQMEDMFDERQKFIFNINRGLYFYIRRDYTIALSSMETSLSIITNFHLEEWELADFYYGISMVYLKQNFILNTIEYATKSLNIYKDTLVFKRAIDCYLVIGLAQNRNLNFKNAEESFLLAKKIADDLKLIEYRGIIFHNLGSLYATQGNSFKAIDYYNNSLIHSDDTYDYLVTLFSIIKEFSKQDNRFEVLRTSKRGIEIIEKESILDYKSFYYHFQIYSLLNRDITQLEIVLIDAIKYFESSHDYRHAHKYSVLLGDTYHQSRKYKNSVIYLQKANHFLYLIKNINYWEDL